MSTEKGKKTLDIEQAVKDSRDDTPIPLRTSLLHQRIDTNFELSSTTSQQLAEDDDSYNITKPSNRYIRGTQYLCMLTACIGIVFFVFYWKKKEVAVQYFQIAFITALTIALDSNSYIKQRAWLCMALIIIICWMVVWLSDGNNIGSSWYDTLMAIGTGVFFLGGEVLMAWKCLNAPPHVRFVQLDLLLYLISLNASCFFSSNEFNNNLHMVLDIRTVMMLYTCLYQPRQKMELLRIPTFPLCLFLIISSFIIYGTNMASISIAGNTLYTFMGFILIYESFNVAVVSHNTRSFDSKFSLA